MSILHRVCLELFKVDIPVLIIQGTTDLQITVQGATEMSNSTEFAILKIIEGMNHVLRECSSDVTENLATYNNAESPLHDTLIEEIKYYLDSNK